jgi:integrase
MTTGITKRHSKGCRSRDGGRCNCKAGWEAWVWLPREKRKVSKMFQREAEAKTWRADALVAANRGGLRAPKPTTIREAWDAWYEGAQGGTIRNRSGDPYKPSALRSYESAMRLRILPAFGAVRVADVRRADLQEFADGLLTAGLDPSTIQVTLLPLRAIFRRALARGELAANPCTGLQLAAVRGKRDRFASPQEARQLIAAVPPSDRAIWATAMYGGLRRGELQALRVEDVDLAVGVIRVERGWDFKEGPIELKSNAGRRRVPIPAILRDHLDAYLIDRQGLAFGRTPRGPFRPESVQKRADAAWTAAGLDRLTLHECRHSFASLMIAAGVNAKALSTYMGHANISITLDRYGHLMPGNEDEAAGLLDAYLTAEDDRAAERARAADERLTGERTGERVGE